MHTPKESIPVKFAVPGATARQLLDFGDATNFGEISGEYFSIGAGTDIAPLLQGLTNDSCAAPHWGYIISGDPTYITSYNNARSLIRRLERDEILEEFVRFYITEHDR